MKKREIFIGVLIVSIGAFLTVFAMNPGSKNKTAEKREAGQTHLVDVNNKPVDFSAFKGKVVFVNNWASWCPPCIAEMPTIQELKNKVKGEDIVFVMVSFDEDPEKAKSFMGKKGYDFEVYFPGESYPYPTSSIPATFVLDKSGQTVSEHVGMADYSGDDLAEQLKALASEGS